MIIDTTQWEHALGMPLSDEFESYIDRAEGAICSLDSADKYSKDKGTGKLASLSFRYARSKINTLVSRLGVEGPNGLEREKYELLIEALEERANQTHERLIKAGVEILA